MSFKNFNRHEIFASTEMNMMRDILEELDTNLIEHGRPLFNDLKNKLFGLFDGFIYSDLITLAKTELSEESIAKLSNLIEKIEAHITEHGEDKTIF